MAGTTKRTTTRKRSTAAKPRQTKSNLHAKKQMWAVVLFALGILIGALTWIEGARMWQRFHHILFGLLGWSVYFLAPLMIYIAVIAAKDKPMSTIKNKLWQAMVLILLISSAIQIFGSGLPDAPTLVDNIVALYEDGKDLKGGGIAGALFSLPLIKFFDDSGASIIILLAIFVFVMLITGSTLISLFQTASKPVKDLEEVYTEAVETRKERRANQKAAPPPPKAQTAAAATTVASVAGQPKFDIDIDISGDSDPEEILQAESEMPQHPVISPKEAEPEPDPVPDVLFQDLPVEFISPDEFTVAEPQPEPEPEPEPLHPLEDEILQAEEKVEDTADIDDIIDRFRTGQADLTAEQEPVEELIITEPIEVVESEPAAQPEPEPIPVMELASEPVEEIPAEIVEYHMPPLNLLKPGKAAASGDVSDELKTNAQTLVDTLKSFGVQTRIIDICRGPAVTRYELQPSAGVKISKITGLADDIALNLAAAGIRIEAPIPNKAAVGIEVPNKKVSMVSIREILESREFDQSDSSVTVALGKDIAGNIMLADLAKMPHLLIAGATGSGKSVCINSIIVSLLYKSSPEDVKLLMVDPKVVELGIYNGIPHLLVPVVTDPKKAAGALNWAVTEMLNRYKTFADNSVRDIAGYNKLAKQSDTLQPMPKIVVIIDELADLMMAAPGDVEDAICRLAQMARAAGMHLVIATQRPSVDVITGVIKANIPSRVAFAVSSQVDSRTILDMGGAEKLLGRGDMLYYPVGASKPQRVQGCFVTDTEVEKVVGFVKGDETASYDQTIVEEIDRHAVSAKSGGKNGKDSGGGFDDEDEMLPQAIECVVEAGQASTSQLQRRLKLGYARAARIIDQLEERGIVGPFEGSKPRQVMISKDRWMEMKLSGAGFDQVSFADQQPESAEGIDFTVEQPAE